MLGATSGAVQEWLNWRHWKCRVPERVPWVRIPPAPPVRQRRAGLSERIPMSESKGNSRAEPRRWFCYMLGCADGSYYIGVATDPADRTKEHNAGQGGAVYAFAPPRSVGLVPTLQELCGSTVAGGTAEGLAQGEEAPAGGGFPSTPPRLRSGSLRVNACVHEFYPPKPRERRRAHPLRQFAKGELP